MSQLLCIGDVMLDVIAVLQTKINYGSDTPSKISTHGGGAAGNVASWAQISGAPTQIVARVGNDSAGMAVMAEFDALGVAHGDCVLPGAQTGVVVVLVDPNGERTMFPESGANSGLSMKELPSLEGVEIVYLSGYALLDELSRPGVLEMIEEIHTSHIPIFFDPATVGGMSQVDVTEIKSWLPHMSALFMNEEEATFLTGFTHRESALNALLEFSPTAIIKCGSQGAVGKTRDGEIISIPAAPTHVIDTTGAGDSFAGGFIATWLKDRDLQRCMEAGATTAARAVAIIGARPHVTPAD